MTTCDYHDWPLVDGIHQGPADPEGIEGITRVPCGLLAMTPDEAGLRADIILWPEGRARSRVAMILRILDQLRGIRSPR